MTTRLLVIGNSHAAALRLAARDHASDWPGLQIDFAAMHGEVSNFRAEGGILTGARAEDCARLRQISGQDSFRLADYSAVAVCGDTPSGFHVTQLWLKARCPALPSTEGVALHRSPDWALLSNACFLAALAGLMRRARAFPLLQALADQGVPRLFLIPTPLLSAQAIDQGPRYAGFSQAFHQGDAPSLGRLADQALAAACQGLATPLPWPEEVRQHGLFTQAAFRAGARRLSGTDGTPQPQDDCLHANAAYGRAVLTALFRHL